MNPEDPESAHRIVAEYGLVLETSAEGTFPASIRSLPYPKQTIKTAILTCTAVLESRAELTPELRDFLEEAYVGLADYVEEDLVRVMAEYRDALASVAQVAAPRDRLQTPAWQRVAETSRLAGEIAKTIAEDTTTLRREFRARA